MKSRISTDGGERLGDNPFAGLNLGDLPSAPEPPRPAAPVSPAARPARRGRVHLRLEKSGRGGKTVTVLFGEGIARLDGEERRGLLRALKNSLGCGGAVGDGDTLELQGDERPRLADWLRGAGFN